MAARWVGLAAGQMSDLDTVICITDLLNRHDICFLLPPPAPNTQQRITWPDLISHYDPQAQRVADLT